MVAVYQLKQCFVLLFVCDACSFLQRVLSKCFPSEEGTSCLFRQAWNMTQMVVTSMTDVKELATHLSKYLVLVLSHFGCHRISW